MKLENEMFRYFFVLLAFIAIHCVFSDMLPTYLILRVMLMVYAAYIGVKFMKSAGDVDGWIERKVKEETRGLWSKIIGFAFFLCACVFPVSLVVPMEETTVMLSQAISIPAVYVLAMVPMFLGKGE